MIVVLIELITSFIQYLSILVQTQDTNFPDSWKSPFNYLSAFNLHFDFLAAYFPGLSDIRLYFTVVSVVGPLSFVIFGLIFLNRKLVVLWYIIFLCGVMAFIAGAFARVIAAVTELPLSAQLAEYMMYVGFAVAVVCLAVYCLVRKCMDEKVFQGKKKELETETEKLNKLATFQRFFLTLVFLGFFFTGGFWLAPYASTNSTILVFWTGFTWACLGFAGLCFIWGLVGLCVAGRKVQWTVGQWAEVAFLRILLIAMSLLYIPIGSGVFLVFNCNDLTCADNQRLPDAGSSVLRNLTSAGVLSSVEQCLAAPFSTQQCPSTLHASLCKANTEYRLEYDVTTKCLAMQTFFWPAAALIIIMFVLGAPVLFQQMISRGSDLLISEFPLMYDYNKKKREAAALAAKEEGKEDGGEEENKSPDSAEKEKEDEDNKAPTDEERWDMTLAASDNVAKFLYQPFTQKYRYVRLFQLVQKLIIVAATMYVLRTGSVNPSYIAIGVSLLVHVLATAALMYHKPFLMNFESKIAILMSSALTVACMLGLLLLSGLVIPGWVMLIVIILNGVLPLIALIIGIVLEYSRGKAADQEEEQRRKNQMLKDVHKQEQEEEQAVLVVLAAHNNELQAKNQQEEDDRKLAQQIAVGENLHATSTTATTGTGGGVTHPSLLIDGASPHYVVELDEQPSSPQAAAPARSPRQQSLPMVPPPLPPSAATNPQNGTLTAHHHHHHPGAVPQGQAPLRTPNRSPNTSPQPQAIIAHDGHYQQTHHQQHPHHSSTQSHSGTSGTGGSKKQTKYITGEETILLPTASQKVLKHTKRVLEAEKEIAEQIKKDSEELKEMQEDVDLRIDYDIKKMLNRFLMGAGVLGFLALGLCILGLLIDLEIGDAQTKTVDHVYGGYNRWDNFTQHCCCIPYYNPVGSERQHLEKWVCQSGRTIEKVRMLNVSGVETSGYGARGLCQSAFATSGCSENYNFELREDSATVRSLYGVSCAASTGVTTAELGLM